MKSIKQRIAAFLLAVMMTVSGMPIQAFAETTNSPPEEVESVLRLDNNNKTQPLETEDTTNEQPTEPKDKPSTTQDQPAIKEDAPEEAETLDISEDKTSEDMDKQKASNDNTTEGDPEGTVTSKDGKTRITNFEAHWVGTDEDTVLGTTLDGAGETKIAYNETAYGEVVNHNNTKLQVKYVISGERLYAPGMIKIKLPYYSRAEGYPESYVEASNIPMPKAKIVDGKIDYDADYGKAEYIYYIDGDDLIVTNTTTIPAATSGTFLIDYFFPTDFVYHESNKADEKYSIPEDVRNMPDMYKFEIRPKISIDVNSDEKITKDSHKLYHQVDKTISGKIIKKGNLGIPSSANIKKDETEIFYKGKYGDDFYPSYGTAPGISEWQNEWGDKIKPEKSEDYYYMIYEIKAFVGSAYSNTSLNVEDILGENQGQKIIGYQFTDEVNRFSIFSEKLNDKFVPYNKDELNNELLINKNGPTFDYGSYSYSNGKTMYLLAAFKKDMLLDQKEHRFTNTGKITIKQLNSDDKPQTYTDNTKIDVKRVPLPPKAEFSAPPGNKFSFIKYLIEDSNETSSLSKTIIRPANKKDDIKLKDGNTNYNSNYSWTLKGMVEALSETYDSKFGDKDNLDAYKRKTYKAELVDDYLYTGNDYKRELSSEDYEVNGITLEINGYDYKRISRTKIGYTGANYGKDGITYPSKIYGRKESTGKWVEIASFDLVKIDSYKIKILNYNSSFNIKPPLFNGKNLFYYDVDFQLPKGFTSVKWEIETNIPKVVMKMRINATLKPSDYINKMFKQNETSPGNSRLMIRNDGTLRVIDNDGQTIGIPSTTKRDKNNSRTLDLDMKNYGQEMYHDTAYWNLILKTPKDKVFEQKLSKNIHDVRERKVINDRSEKTFIVPASVEFKEHVKNDNGISLREYNDGTFYDLLPIGVSGVKNLKIYDTKYSDENSKIFYKDKDTSEPNYKEWIPYSGGKYLGYYYLNTNYKLIENWQNTGRTLLVAKYDNAELVIPEKLKEDEESYLKNASAGLTLSYDMIYPWDSYKDYGDNLYNFVAFESGKESMESGLPDVPNFKEETEHHKIANKALKDLNKDNDNKNFLYAMDKTIVSGNTAANTGLTKHIKDSKDPKYSLATKTREGGQYSYRIRMQSLSGTTTSNLIFYDSIENYKPLKTDEDYGVKRWKGTLEGIDLTHAKMKGVDPKVYITTLKGLNMQENKDITNTNVWKPYKEGDDLSKVQAIAIDLRKKTDGSDFKLKEEESISVTLNMRAPWGTESKQIDKEAKALNEIYANTTITTDLNNKSTNKLINTAYTAIELEPVETETTIKAKKSYLDKEDKAIELKGNDFEFNLKDSSGKVLQTKTNDKDGNITFDPIKYHSWDVGEHTYTIEEVKGKDNKIAYDKHIETVKVKVERPETSEIKSSVEYDKDGSNFTNKEKKSASLQLVKLKADEEKFNLEEIKDKDGNLTSYKVPDADLGKTLDGAVYELYKLNEGKEELVATLTTKNGISNVVEELEAGSYKLVETKAPSGYHLAEDALEFKITDEDAGKVLAKFVTDKGIEDLPSTGGRGTKIFIGTGVTLLGLMVGAMYIANKKKKQATTK